MAFEDAVINNRMSSDAAFLYTYGLYLSNGGSYEGFMDLDIDDVQLMYVSYEVTRRKNINETLKGIASMFGATDSDGI